MLANGILLELKMTASYITEKNEIRSSSESYTGFGCSFKYVFLC